MTDYQREKGSQIDPENVTKEELQDELRTLDQPISGTKEELAQRLEEARGSAAGSQEDPVAALAAEEPDEDAPHEVRGDGSIAYFSQEDREKASYDRERGTDT